jgi:hypothetical protein
MAENEPQAGGLSASHPELETLPILVSPSTEGKGRNTIRMELIPIACWKLDDVRFAFGSSFVLPSVKKEFADLDALRKKHPNSPLSVFGHADPTGDEAFNKLLSGNRAESIYAVLTRDVPRWEQLYKSGGSSEGWGIRSIQHMLTALGHDPGPVDGVDGPKTQAGVKSFQRKAGLSDDGVAGPKTREKLFPAYMDYLCPFTVAKTEFLGQGADPGGKADIQGCGEMNPYLVFSQSEQAEFSKAANKSARDAENAPNRRVLVLLFRPGTTVSLDKWPCPRVDEGLDRCRLRLWSDGEERRQPQAARRKFSDSEDTFACRFYHRLVTLSPCEGIIPKPKMEWIQVTLIGRPQSNPKPYWPKTEPVKYPQEPFSATLTDRSEGGKLDANALSRFERVPAGKCSYRFTQVYAAIETEVGPEESWPAIAPTPGTTPGGGGGGTPPLPPCPTVEIEINNTPAANDDLVLIKSDRPARRHKVKARIRSTSGPTENVVLTNPDGRLRFPEAADTSLTLSVPAGGAWVEFEISGETGSAAIGDAKIEAHCRTATGDLIGTKDVTVVWFDEAKMSIANPGTYSIVGTRLTATGGNAVDLSAEARIRPAGVDCAAPQLANLRIGIMQNALAGITREWLWDNPSIVWLPGVAPGTVVDVPTVIRQAINRPAPGNDTAASVAPLYDQPGKADTLDANSLKPPKGCTGGGVATSRDTPSNGAAATLVVPAESPAGVTVGQVTYRAQSAKILVQFLTWTVVFDTAKQEFSLLRERGWGLNVDGRGPGTKKATVAASDTAPTTDAVLAPLANTQSNDPANFSQGPQGAATVRFTR